MTRKNGTFPSHSKINIDPEVWPSQYWDSAKRCSSQDCATLWPNNDYFTVCPDCDSKLHLTKNESPDMRWPEAVRRLLTAVFERIYERWNDGATDEELYWEELKTNGNLDDDKVIAAVNEFVDEAATERVHE